MKNDELELINDREGLYMKDSKIMWRIQIEGDARELVMDAEGQIFDLQLRYIGTAKSSVLTKSDSSSALN